MAHRYKEGEYDIREDEEQEAKEAECMQLLVSAGYFRARIRGLAAFDKLVGGLCWCVQGCSMDIDADLLFHEGSSIGQKIALTEKIVRALRRMRCPHAIEPHQIQGRDFVHVFPVVQWLVTQVIGRRDQMTADWRDFAVEQYRLLRTGQAAGISPELAAAASALSERRAQLKAAFPTMRRLRKPAAYRGSQVLEETQVRTTLLEYNGGLGAIAGATAAGAPTAAVAGSGGGVGGGAAAPVELAEMGDAGQQKRLAASLVGTIVGLQSADIQRALQDFGAKQTELAQQLESLRQLSPEQQLRLRAGMEERLETARQQAEQAAEREQAARDRRDQEAARLAEAERQRADLDAQLTALGAVAQDPRAAAKLDRLVSAAEELRQREADQKAALRAEAAELESELARLRERVAATGDADAEAANSERVAKATEQATVAAERLAAVRAQLAESSRACASLRRRIDEFPSQEEASQYMRRLLELAEQAATLHRQTKQFYCLYNSACSLRELLEREIQLLASVEDNYRQTEKSPAGRQELAAQLERIVESARQNQSQGERRLATEKAKRDGLNSEYLRLVDSERRYNKLVKDFRTEAAKNERLTAVGGAA